MHFNKCLFYYKKDRQRTNFDQTLLLVVLYGETLNPIGFSLAYWLVLRS